MFTESADSKQKLEFAKMLADRLKEKSKTAIYPMRQFDRKKVRSLSFPSRTSQADCLKADHSKVGHKSVHSQSRSRSSACFDQFVGSEGKQPLFSCKPSVARISSSNIAANQIPSFFEKPGIWTPDRNWNYEKYYKLVCSNISWPTMGIISGYLNLSKMALGNHISEKITNFK